MEAIIAREKKTRERERAINKIGLWFTEIMILRLLL